MDNRRCLIDERKTFWPIPQTSPTKNKDNNYFTNKEYSLNENLFDPSKSSPPNNFLEKLQLRMSIYNSFNKLDSLIKE
jgi:hypothetical protein